MSEPVIRSIPLSQLELSPANVRRTPAAQTAFDELKASIAAHGLLENLIVRCLGPGPDSVGGYAVSPCLRCGLRLAPDRCCSIELPPPFVTRLRGSTSLLVDPATDSLHRVFLFGVLERLWRGPGNHRCWRSRLSECPEPVADHSDVE